MDTDANAPVLLHSFFERAVVSNPGGIAVDVPPSNSRERRRATYEELDRRARAIARRLASLVDPGGVVVIFVPRHDIDAFAAQLAALRAGLAYTCIDPAFPDAHASFIVEDVRAKVIVADRAHAARARAGGCRVEHIVELHDVPDAPDASVRAHPRPSDLAYVIYTSGTTGRPKGVMIEHRSIANLVASDVEHFALVPSDRVAQGSSLAYDSAIEETWLAFSAGATLVVLDDETARLGPDLIPWLQRERISVFCPPPTLLRATGCREPASALPQLRLLYVGGEALPQDVADRWARGRHLENGYGPTECSVTALRTRILEREPVTIGLPVRGNRAILLDDEGREIEDDRPGELCLAGIGLARGYLNQPELTAEKFPVHPLLGRIYRTGDLVRRGKDGRFVYLGRIDAQVKLRGYRIELSAIESLLAHQPGVRAAACAVQEELLGPILVAFVVPVDATTPPRVDELKANLARELPSYMIPARIGVARELPVSVGGKLDRAKLPRIEASRSDAARTTVEPRDAVEMALRDAFRATLGLAAGQSIADDFFLDLGGDSLRAAEAVSLLRTNPLTEHLTVRDLYAGRTIAAIAAITPARRGTSSRRERPAALPLVRVLLSNTIQVTALLAFVLTLSAVAWFVAERAVPALGAMLDLPLALACAPIVYAIGPALYTPCAIAFAVVTKRLLVGKYVAARAPVFSGLHVRHWLVQQAARCIPWGSISGTEFECRALRALGAKIGSRVHIHRGVALGQGGWDLLDLGDDVTIAQDASLRLVDLEDGALVVGPVRIGAGSTVDVRAGMSAHSSLGTNAYLGPLSWLPAGVHVPDDRRFDGVPAADTGPAPDAERIDEGREWSPTTHAWALLAARGATNALFALPLTLIVVFFAWDANLDWSGLVNAFVAGSWSVLGVTKLAFALCAAVPATLLLGALLARAIGPVRPGSMRRASPAHVRIVLKTNIVQAAGTWLSGTLFWPAWLRLAGMRVGRGGEISTILDVVPELVEIGEESFLADGIYLGGPRIHRGVVTAGRTTLGKRTFLGNHAVVVAGHRLPDDLLVGVCTVTDPNSMRADSAWFGHPPFALPRRTQTEFDRSLTHEPTFVRRFNRVAWELARFALPIPPLLTGLWAAAWLAHHVGNESSFLFGVAQFAGVTCAVSAAGPLIVLILKWVLLGRVRPGQHPLWSCWCSRWDFHYVVWALYARGVLASLEGTSLLAWYLRAMGAKVGRRVVLAGGFAQVVDPDMLEFEDDVTVHALFQAHSFEDRVLKIDRVCVRRNADVGPGAVLFHGADIGEGAKIQPHSVVMKRERVPGARTYVGCPVRAEE